MLHVAILNKDEALLHKQPKLKLMPKVAYVGDLYDEPPVNQQQRHKELYSVTGCGKDDGIYAFEINPDDEIENQWNVFLGEAEKLTRPLPKRSPPYDIYLRREIAPTIKNISIGDAARQCISTHIGKKASKRRTFNFT